LYADENYVAFLYAVEVLPLQYRSQVQSSANLVFWFIAFLAVYFGGQQASKADGGSLIYIWFCLGGAIITTLSFIFIKESKFEIFQFLSRPFRGHLLFRDSKADISFSKSEGPYARRNRFVVGG